MSLLKDISDNILDAGDFFRRASDRFNPFNDVAKTVVKGTKTVFDNVTEASEKYISHATRDNRTVGETIGVFSSGSITEDDIKRAEEGKPVSMLESMSNVAEDEEGRDLGEMMLESWMENFTNKKESLNLVTGQWESTKKMFGLDMEPLTEKQKERQDYMRGVVNSVPDTITGLANVVNDFTKFMHFGLDDGSLFQSIQDNAELLGAPKRDFGERVTLQELIGISEETFRPKNEREETGALVGDMLQMLIPGAGWLGALDKLVDAGKISKKTGVIMGLLGEIGLGVGFEAAKEGEVNREAVINGTIIGMGSMGLNTVFRFVSKKIGGRAAVKALREDLSKVIEQIGIEKGINVAPVYPGGPMRFKPEPKPYFTEPAIKPHVVKEVVEEAPEVLARDNVYNVQDLFPNTRSTKRKVEIETGIKNKPTIIIEGDDILEFGSKDIAKFYRSIEKERATTVRGKFKTLIDKAREERLGGVIQAETRDILGGRPLVEATDAELNFLNSRLEVLLADKKQLLLKRLEHTEKQSAWEIVKGFINRAFNNPRFSGRKVATQFDLADAAKRVQNTADLNAVSALRGMDDETALGLKHLIEGGEGNTTAAGRKLLEQWGILQRVIAERAREAGIVMGNIENYFPRYLKSEFIDGLHKKKTAKKAVELLMKSGMSESRAKQIWGDYSASIFKNRKAGHLEISRNENLPKEFIDEFFETDPRIVLPKYINEANTRIADVVHLGDKDEIVLNIIRSMEKSGDIAGAQNAFRQYEGMIAKHGQNAISAKLAVVNALKLMLSPITNLGEITLTAVRVGPVKAFKAGFEAMTKKGRAKALTFADLEGTLKHSQETLGVEQGLADKILKYFQFTRTQSWADRVKVLSGVDYAKSLSEELIKKPNSNFLRRRLEIMGLDPDHIIKDGLGEMDLIIAGNKMLSDLLPVNRADLPIYWKHPVGREVFRFKSFAHKTGNFLYKDVIKEAVVHGNFKPLANFVIVGSLMGEVVIDAKDLIKKGEIRETPKNMQEAIERVMDNLMAAGGAGLVMDYITSVKYGKWFGYLGTYLGPIAGDIEQLSRAVFNDIDDPKQTAKNLADFFLRKTTTAAYSRFKVEMEKRDVIGSISKKAGKENLEIEERDNFIKALQEKVDEGELTPKMARKKLKELDTKQEDLVDINKAIEVVNNKDMDDDTVKRYMKFLRKKHGYKKSMVKKIGKEFLSDSEVEEVLNEITLEEES